MVYLVYKINMFISWWSGPTSIKNDVWRIFTSELIYCLTQEKPDIGVLGDYTIYINPKAFDVMASQDIKLVVIQI